jgi:chromosome segregation ATPase
LQSKVEEKEKVITKLNQEIDALKSDNEIQIQSLKQQLAEKESEIEALKKNLIESKEHIESSDLEFSKLRENLTEKEKDVERLNQQIHDLTDSLNNRSLNRSSVSHLDESQSEVMSTSTISKAEEVNRMADIEATFEDRYTKLKLVAIKLKKKTVDQVK